MTSLLAEWQEEIKPALAELVPALANADESSVITTLQRARHLLARLPALSTATGITDRELTTLYLMRAVLNDIYFNIAMDSTVELPDHPNPDCARLVERVMVIVQELGRFLQDILGGEAATNPLVGSVSSFVGLLASMDESVAARRESSK